MSFTLQPLGYIESCFAEKFGIPRQPLLAPSAKGKLVLLPPFDDPDMVEGLDQASHIWLSFIFHQNIAAGWKPKVRPPRLGGNKKQGVLATRSSFRPNHLGLSVVRLEEVVCVEGKVILMLSGIDLVHGTPVVDIKPYIPYVDHIDSATHQIAAEPPVPVAVDVTDAIASFGQQFPQCPSDGLAQLLIELLCQDPRPAYQAYDEQRIYGMKLRWAEQLLDVRWCYRQHNDQWSIRVVEVVADEVG